VNTFNRLAIGVVATAAALAPVLVVVPAANAQTYHWTVIERSNNARHGACKVPVNKGTSWKIFNRLDSRQATGGRLRATMTVTVNGANTSRKWASGWVRRGHLSAVGSVIMPRKPGRQLVMTLAGDNSGSGGTVAIRAIGRC
jgi:hypothetical protein